MGWLSDFVSDPIGTVVNTVEDHPVLAVAAAVAAAYFTGGASLATEGGAAGAEAGASGFAAGELGSEVAPNLAGQASELSGYNAATGAAGGAYAAGELGSEVAPDLAGQSAELTGYNAGMAGAAGGLVGSVAGGALAGEGAGTADAAGTGAAAGDTVGGPAVAQTGATGAPSTTKALAEQTVGNGVKAAAPNSGGLIDSATQWAKANPGLAAGTMSVAGHALGGLATGALGVTAAQRKADLDLRNKEQMTAYYRDFVQGGSAGGGGVTVTGTAPAQARPLLRTDGTPVYSSGGLIASK